jgi:hypothetical protein
MSRVYRFAKHLERRPKKQQARRASIVRNGHKKSRPKAASMSVDDQSNLEHPSSPSVIML